MTTPFWSGAAVRPGLALYCSRVHLIADGETAARIPTRVVRGIPSRQTMTISEAIRRRFMGASGIEILCPIAEPGIKIQTQASLRCCLRTSLCVLQWQIDNKSGAVVDFA